MPLFSGLKQTMVFVVLFMLGAEATMNTSCRVSPGIQ
jgi:hypothetical protein